MLGPLWTDQPSAPTFAKDFSTKLAAQVQSLLDAGAGYVFVPGLYAKDISPSAQFYADTPAKVANLGAIIQEANTAIEAALKPMGPKVLYYDVYCYMKGLWTDAAANGFTHVGKEFCDGFSEEDFQLCLVPGKSKDQFFWTQYLDMTTRVHSLIAQDMAKAIMGHKWE